MRFAVLLLPLMFVSCIKTYVYKIDYRQDKRSSMLIGRFAPGVYKKNFFIRKLVLQSVENGKTITSTFRVKESEFDDFHLFVVDNIMPGRYVISSVELEQRDVHSSSGMVSWAVFSSFFKPLSRSSAMHRSIHIPGNSLVWAGELTITSEVRFMSPDNKLPWSTVAFTCSRNGYPASVVHVKHPLFVGTRMALESERQSLKRVQLVCPYHYDWYGLIDKRIKAIDKQLKSVVGSALRKLRLPMSGMDGKAANPGVDPERLSD